MTLKTRIFTHHPLVSIARFTFWWWRHNRLAMTSQWPDNCDANTWQVISNSLDIDFIHGGIHELSCKKYMHQQFNITERVELYPLCLWDMEVPSTWINLQIIWKMKIINLVDFGNTNTNLQHYLGQRQWKYYIDSSIVIQIAVVRSFNAHYTNDFVIVIYTRKKFPFSLTKLGTT